jgi:4-hydroxybenzoyl-CoA thioesterase/acyl-CoA thioester hydrolase
MDGPMEALSEHRYTRRVQFYETDLAGMVHFSWYLRYMEEAEHALWRQAGLSIAPPGDDLGFPRVSATVDFHAPLRFEDVFDVWIRVEAITKRTFTYASTITRGDTRIATGSITTVCVRKHPLQAIDIPDEIAKRFAVYGGDTRIG